MSERERYEKEKKSSKKKKSVGAFWRAVMAVVTCGTIVKSISNKGNK